MFPFPGSHDLRWAVAGIKRLEAGAMSAIGLFTRFAGRFIRRASPKDQIGGSNARQAIA
jgi:hypothetical protein